MAAEDEGHRDDDHCSPRIIADRGFELCPAARMKGPIGADAEDKVPTARGKVTLREIAAAAGVSVSTASRALNHAPGMSQAVRARVQSTAARLNYAGALVEPTRFDILSNLNSMELGAGDFMQALIRGIEKECKERRITPTLRLMGSGWSAASNSDGGSADGCLMLSMQDEGIIQKIVQQGIPATIVNGREPLMRLDAVAPANRTGGYLAARHLLELGHRRILAFAFSRRPTIRDRLAGYHEAMREACGDGAEVLVEELAAMRSDVAYDVVKARLNQKKRQDFTAIQCCNDGCAFGAMTAVLEAGLRIPQDIAIIGFDDIPTAAMAICPLTTIRVDCEELGASAVRRLVERIKSPHLLTTYTEYAVELITRESTGPAPGP